MKIDKTYLDSAKYIRNEYEKLLSKVSNYEKQAIELKDYFESKAKQLLELNNTKVSKVKTKGDVESVTSEIMSIINDLEQESEKVGREIENINKKIESLSKDEVILFDTIKEKYSDLSDDEISDQVWEHIKKGS
jgi:chromosome segregation ATPase